MTQPAQSANPKPQSMLCPRCDSRLKMSLLGEPECLQCGYADYQYVPPIKQNARNILSGTTYTLRYSGYSAHLRETLCYVKAVRKNNYVAFAVSCPWCRAAMEQTSLSGKRRERSEERYCCPKNYRVSLVNNNGLTWR